jgi:hypothetical protein
VKWAALAASVALVIGIGAPRLFRTINDDKRSFWSEEEEQDYVQNDIFTTDTTVDFNTSITSGADEGFPDWGLTLSVKDVTSTGLTLVCSRKGGNPTGELECGTDYHLIVLENGTWKDVPTVIEEYAWNSLAYWISEGQDTEFDISWEWLYGKQTKVDVTSSDGSMSPNQINLGDRTTEELMQMFKALGSGSGDGQGAS